MDDASTKAARIAAAQLEAARATISALDARTIELDGALMRAERKLGEAGKAMIHLADRFEVYADDCDEFTRRGMGNKTRNKHRAGCWREAAQDVREIGGQQ